MFNKTSINLIGNRLGGERFPQVNGNFMLVDKCDIPCEISIDGSFYFTAREGLDIRGHFDELYVRHPEYIKGDDYFGFSDGLPLLRIITSPDSAINNYFSDQYFPCGLPFNTIGTDITAPIFGNIRYVRPSFSLHFSNAAPVNPTDVLSTKPTLECRFFRTAAQLSQGVSQGGFDLSDPDGTGSYSVFNHGGGNGNSATVVGEYQLLKFTGVGSYQGTAIFEGWDIPVPSGANFVRFRFVDSSFFFIQMTDFTDGSPVSSGTIFAK